MNRLDPRRAGVWADVLTVISIVAVGVCVAGVIERMPPADRPTENVAATTTEPTTEAPVDTTFLEPDVDVDAPIAGCDVVIAPEPSATWGQVFTSEDAYDNPQYPWYDGPRSVMMTDALAAALPDRVEVLFASRRESLIFQPIPPTTPDTAVTTPGFAMAAATLTRGDDSGMVAVSVSKSTEAVPDCVAGQVQERTTTSDGTVDVNESWYQYGSDRTNFRSVTGYYPDGSQVVATASDATGTDMVLSMDELKSIVQLPEMRVSTPVPAGTPRPSAGCNGSYGFDPGAPAIDAATADTLNDALRAVDVGESFSPRLDTLMLADFVDTVACTHVDVVNTGASLSISIHGGVSLPVMPDVYDPEYANRPDRFETLDSGAVLEVEAGGYSYSPASQDGPNGGSNRTVTVTYPSGTQVEVRSDAENPDEPLGEDKLVAIATADGLDAL